MKLYPQIPSIADNEGFKPETDIFGRKSLGEGLTRLLSSASDPLVVALDGAWGSGKTTFLKMWAGSLRSEGYPVIYFDAFENDYVEDAFAVMARELVDLVEHNTDLGDQVAVGFRDKAVELGVLLLKGVGRVGAKVAVAAATGGLVRSVDLENLQSDITSEAQSVAERYMTDILDQPRKQKSTVEEFRKALEHLPKLLSSGSDEKPLIFIVDELDRCKPLFALSLLERIKHFMNVPNVHFLLGVHLPQLESSVRFAYGSDVDARLYLQKFINLMVPLEVRAAGRRSESDYERFTAHLCRELGVATQDRQQELAVESIQRLAVKYQLSLRSLERVFTLLVLATTFIHDRTIRLGDVVGALSVMKVKDPNLYQKARRGELSLPEAAEFIGFNAGLPFAEMDWEGQWWCYLLSNENLPEFSEFAKSFRANYRVRSRLDIVPSIANDVIDFLWQ